MIDEGIYKGNDLHTTLLMCVCKTREKVIARRDNRQVSKERGTQGSLGNGIDYITSNFLTNTPFFFFHYVCNSKFTSFFAMVVGGGGSSWFVCPWSGLAQGVGGVEGYEC